MTKKRVGLYTRVSTARQDTTNQKMALIETADQAGWEIVHIFEDKGVSGAKGKDQRPAFNALLDAAMKREIDIIACWSIDRLGRSLQDLVNFLNDIQAAGVDLFILKQALDTTTPSGRMLFSMVGVFSEFERSIIRQRVRAGLDKAKANGKTLGRPQIEPEKEQAIKDCLGAGTGILKTAKTVGVGTSVVQRIRAEMNLP